MIPDLTCSLLLELGIWAPAPPGMTIRPPSRYTPLAMWIERTHFKFTKTFNYTSVITCLRILFPILLIGSNPTKWNFNSVWGKKQNILSSRSEFLSVLSTSSLFLYIIQIIWKAWEVKRRSLRTSIRRVRAGNGAEPEIFSLQELILLHYSMPNLKI